MKFVQRSLDESKENSSGGGTRAQTRELVVLIGLTLLTFAGLFVAVSWITDTVVSRLSPQREAKIFAFYGDALTEEAKIPDDLTRKWEKAQSLLQDLSGTPELSGLTFKLGYLASDEPNAFAVPGGMVVLTRGLLRGVESDIGLAFVLAHELGHFANRDHLRGLGRQLGFKLTLALLFGTNDGFTGNASDLLLLRHSRAREAAADDFAMTLLQEQFETIEGAGELFKLLQAKSTLPEWAYMFTTHPGNLERLKKIAADTY